MLNSRIDQVYLATGATDLRKSIDGLAILVTESFNLDPFSRNLFEKLPNIDLDNMEELDQLLPWSNSIPVNCKIPNKE